MSQIHVTHLFLPYATCLPLWNIFMTKRSVVFVTLVMELVVGIEEDSLNEWGVIGKLRFSLLTGRWLS